ncbi:unnamed protein product, partial [Polarella glacialis]
AAKRRKLTERSAAAADAAAPAAKTKTAGASPAAASAARAEERAARRGAPTGDAPLPAANSEAAAEVGGERLLPGRPTSQDEGARLPASAWTASPLVAASNRRRRNRSPRKLRSLRIVTRTLPPRSPGVTAITGRRLRPMQRGPSWKQRARRKSARILSRRRPEKEAKRRRLLRPSWQASSLGRTMRQMRS